jgi:hypothetical protein
MAQSRLSIGDIGAGRPVEMVPPNRLCDLGAKYPISKAADLATADPEIDRRLTRGLFS